MTDILIVGAGSAGSVLAERLSADPARRVTLLEAGPGPADPRIRALTEDAAVLPIGPDSPVARHYPATLTEHPPRTAEIVRGRCLGGSGAINGGYFCRALPADAGMLPGWSWTEMAAHYWAVEDRLGARTGDFGSLTTAFAEAARRAGYPRADLTAGESGLCAVPLNIRDGRRAGPGAVFLEPALARPNLTVLTGTQATRVRLAGHRAVGVEAVGPDGPIRLAADAVVLCAGAIASAQLLMLSGVGPAGDLAALGIPVLADLPVGRRCADHPEWVMTTGWAAEPGRPVLEAVLVVDEVEIRPYTRGFGTPAPAVGVALMRPRARGRLSLVSADPSAPPRIGHRYDSEPADVAGLRRGCELITEMLSGATRLGEPQWSTSQHLCSTAPMGEVVDDRCRVLGLDGLWVVDGSVLAHPPSRGPHATIAMLAHRAADLLPASP